MQADLIALLLATPGLSALVGTRVHWGRLPPVVQGRPYINLTVISDPRQYHYRGVTKLRQTRVQADIWAETVASAVAVGDVLETRLSGFRGDQGTTSFRGLFLIAARDMTGDSTGEVQALFRRSIDFNINWHPKEG